MGHDLYRCPGCVGPLTQEAASLSCTRCALDYPVSDDITDFLRGAYYDHFDESTTLGDEHLRALERELEGAASRINDYYAPLLSTRQRVLDAGCGNGVSVDLLIRQGHDAWGIDSSSLRRWQWRERQHRDRLAVADGAKLPFANGHFDVVLCSGVIEHVGVEELGGDEYRVRRLPHRDEARREFLAGLLRVLRPGGTLYLDFPNGAFPIDFWHNTRGGSARFHSLREGFLPTFGEIVALAKQLDPAIDVTPLSPNGRLRFQQVRAHWYGRAFVTPMQWLFALMDHSRFLSRSPLNPFLVIRLRKPAAS